MALRLVLVGPFAPVVPSKVYPTCIPNGPTRAEPSSCERLSFPSRDF